MVKVLTVTEAKSKLPVHFEHFCRVKEKNRQMTTSVCTIYVHASYLVRDRKSSNFGSKKGKKIGQDFIFSKE